MISQPGQYNVGLPAALFALLAALFTIAAAWSCGCVCTKGQRLPRSLVLALGCGVLSLLVFLTTAAGLANRVVFGLLGVVLITAGTFRRPVFQPVARRRWVWCLAPYAILYSIHALAPEIEVDALTYHLGLPAEYLRLGGFPDRIAFYELLPQATEMLFLFAFAFGGGSAAKLVHLAMLFATVPLIVAVSRHLRLPDWAGPVAGGLYLTVPVAGVSGTSAFNDCALVFATLTVFYLLLDESAPTWQVGLLAGFCYAIKMTGGVTTAAASLVMWRRSGLKAGASFAAGCALMILPWMGRAALLTGNPFAPLLNRWFPNPYFYPSMEADLGRWLADYGGVRWFEIPVELLTGGVRLHGLVGPLALLAPLLLVAMWRREGRWLAGAAAIAGAPWLLNVGARFLLPSLPFIALAVAMVLPRRVAWVVFGVGAVMSWPEITALYAAPGAWILPETPLRAALRLEPEPEYLARVSHSYRAARLVEQHTREGARVLDLMGAANLHTTRELVGSWRSAEGDRLSSAIQLAALETRGVLSEWHAAWTPANIKTLRLTLRGGADHTVEIHDVRLWQGSEAVPPGTVALATARPNPWEAPLAFDGSVLTRWSTRQPARPGMYLEIDLGTPQPLSAVTIVRAGGDRTPVGVSAPGITVTDLTHRPFPAVNWKQAATRLLLRRGVNYILCVENNEAFGLACRSLAEHPGDWGVEAAAGEGAVHLLRVVKAQ